MNYPDSSITLNFSQDQNAVLVNYSITYKRFTRFKRKIWDALRWFIGYFELAFPNQSRLANLAGCCRRTVIRAIQEFIELDWIRTRRQRYNGPLEYYINPILNGVNPKQPKKPVFTPENVTTTVTLLPRPNICEDINLKEEGNLDKEILNDDPETRRIAEKLPRIAPWAINRITSYVKKYGEYLLEETIHKCIMYENYLKENRRQLQAQGKPSKIEDASRYLWSKAKEIKDKILKGKSK